MTAAEIRSQFPAWANGILGDETYGKPTVAWLRDTFWPWHVKRRFDLGLNKWTRKNDCDNSSRRVAQDAADCHALSTGSDAEGITVGEFWYIATTHVKGPHAISVAFTDEGKVFFEPQSPTWQRLALTPIEELSVFHYRF